METIHFMDTCKIGIQDRNGKHIGFFRKQGCVLYHDTMKMGRLKIVRYCERSLFLRYEWGRICQLFSQSKGGSLETDFNTTKKSYIIMHARSAFKCFRYVHINLYSTHHPHFVKNIVDFAYQTLVTISFIKA